MSNITVHTSQGVPLPPNWQADAEANRRNFDAVLKERLANAWKRPLTSNADNFDIQQARLRSDRNDALRIVKDDATEQEWEGDDGVRVKIRK